MKELKSTVDYSHQSNYNQELKLDSLEQYGRSNCVILHDCDANFKQMTSRHIENYALDVINNHLDHRWNRSGFSRPDPTGKFQNHRRLTGF